MPLHVNPVVSEAAHTLAHLFFGGRGRREWGGATASCSDTSSIHSLLQLAPPHPAAVFSGPVIYCNVLIGVYLPRQPESASDEQPGTMVFPGAADPDEKEGGRERKEITPEPLLFVLPFVHSAPCNFSTHTKIVHCAFGNLQRLP